MCSDCKYYTVIVDNVKWILNELMSILTENTKFYKLIGVVFNVKNVDDKIMKWQ